MAVVCSSKIDAGDQQPRDTQIVVGHVGESNLGRQAFATLRHPFDQILFLVVVGIGLPANTI